MRQRLLPIFAIASLFACISFAILTIRSQWIADALRHWYRSDDPKTLPYLYGGTYLVSNQGTLLLRGIEFTITDPTRVAVVANSTVPRLSYEPGPSGNGPNRQSFYGLLGFEWSPPGPAGPSPGATVTMWQLRVPLWFMALLFGILPSVWLLRRNRWLQRRRLAAGLCPACGYDLRATPDGCPECGREANQPL